MDRQRRHREDDASDERRSRAPRPTTADGADATILDLQATAGNRAVSELLGPTAGDVAVQRDTTDGAPAAEPTDTSTASTGNTMSIPDLELSVPIQSVQNGITRPVGSGSSGRERASGDTVVTMALDGHSAALQQAAVQGREFPVATITVGSMTVTLRGVVVSSFQVSKDIVTISLTSSSIEVKPSAGGGRAP